MRHCFRRFFVFAPLLLVAAMPAALRAADVQLGDGQNVLKDEYDKWAGLWSKLINGDPAADPANDQHTQAIDAAAKWAVYRLDTEKDPGKMNDIYRELGDNLQVIRGSKERGLKVAELFTKQVIARALDVETKSTKPIAHINAARLLARLVEQNKDASETREDVLARLAGANQGALADALSAIIKDPAQNDGARFWAFRALRLLLALPQPAPPTLPRDKEEAVLGTVIKFLQDRNKPFPSGATQEEDGYRYLRGEALAALAQCRYPTLTDKSRPTFVLLKVVARDGVAPEPGVAERVEAAIGVAHAQPAFDKDKDYQPDYAAHQLGLFVADFVGRYGQDKQANPDGPAAQPWKVQASRLIEALELMKAQTKNAHVARVADVCTDLLKKVEKGLPGTNPFDLEQVLQAEASPAQSLYKGAAETTVKPANRKDDGPAEKVEEKKDK